MSELTDLQEELKQKHADLKEKVGEIKAQGLLLIEKVNVLQEQVANGGQITEEILANARESVAAANDLGSMLGEVDADQDTEIADV